MNVSVFCSANDFDEKYMAPARGLASLLAEGNHTLVYGGSECGMMKLVADVMQDAGCKIIAVSTEVYKASVRKHADEIFITKNLGERRTMMLDRADAIVVLPGGLGTLDELSEALELKKQNQHDKPVIVLNTAGFYGGLRLQLQRMADEGFLPVAEQEGIAVKVLDQYIQFVDTPQAAMALIEKHELSASGAGLSAAKGMPGVKHDSIAV